MTPPRFKFSNIDDYISGFPVETMEFLEELIIRIVKFRVDENIVK